MSRHVPELALVTGVFLALVAFGTGAALTGDYLRTTLFAVAVSYPFAAYAVSHDDDPTAVLPPTAVGVVAAASGLLVLGAGVLDPTVRASVALLFALFVALPPLAYAVRFGGWDARIGPREGRRIAAAGALAGVVVVAVGGAIGRLTDAAIVGTVAALLPGLYVALRTDADARRRRR